MFTNRLTRLTLCVYVQDAGHREAGAGTCVLRSSEAESGKDEYLWLGTRKTHAQNGHRDNNGGISGLGKHNILSWKLEWFWTKNYPWKSTSTFCRSWFHHMPVSYGEINRLMPLWLLSRPSFRRSCTSVTLFLQECWSSKYDIFSPYWTPKSPSTYQNSRLFWTICDRHWLSLEDRIAFRIAFKILLPRRSMFVCCDPEYIQVVLRFSV